MLVHAAVIISISIFKEPKVNTSSSKKPQCLFMDISFFPMTVSVFWEWNNIKQ